MTPSLRRRRHLVTHQRRLRAQMEALRERKSPEQAEWFANAYAERVKGAILQMGPLVTSCEGNVALKDAMNSVMARDPMMRKKK